MVERLSWLLSLALLAGTAPAQAQVAPAAPGTARRPPPLWDVQVGLSFVGTSGNSQTSSAGADLALHRHWPVWQLEGTASAVRASDHGEQTAERYAAAIRGERVLSPIVKLSSGERLERDRFSGINVRSIADTGLSWAVAKGPGWTLNATTALAWTHEQQIGGPNRDDPVGLLQMRTGIPIGSMGTAAGRFTYYPDLATVAAYRYEAEATAQAAMNSHLSLKLGYLLRYSNQPVAGFKRTDNTTTASLVLSWHSVLLAPAP